MVSFRVFFFFFGGGEKEGGVFISVQHRDILRLFLIKQIFHSACWIWNDSSQLGTTYLDRRLSTISYPTCSRGIIVK